MAVGLGCRDRRILYNRASGRSPGPAVVRATRSSSGGTQRRNGGRGYDVPDFEIAKALAYVLSRRSGDGRDCWRRPVPDAPDGRGWLYVALWSQKTALPVFYEPLESPFLNTLVRQQSDPPDGRPRDPMIRSFPAIPRTR